jgi:large subunit ribosomal protein L29
MKAKELREKKIEELEKILKEKREKLKNLKLDLIQGKLKNVREIRETKRDIARILTILKEKTCQKEDLSEK